jgi:hypothetical protein
MNDAHDQSTPGAHSSRETEERILRILRDNILLTSDSAIASMGGVVLARMMANAAGNIPIVQSGIYGIFPS